MKYQTTIEALLPAVLRPVIIVFLIFCSVIAFAVPQYRTKQIRIDQFGYFPSSKKVAVVTDLNVGDGPGGFHPSTGNNQYQVRRSVDDITVFQGTLQVWNNFNVHDQSGDKGWWFDFSAVTTPGKYYIYDLENNVGSYCFEVGENVYDEVLKHAVRSFYYQRLNIAKEPQFAGNKWSDASTYDGFGQDRSATSRFAKGNAATAKDLHGGWMDAGDVNKYTTFALAPVIQLVEAYRMNPTAFKDDYNIPESGNGIPDVLDEVRYELEFLKRMQDATGTSGFFLKVGVDNSSDVTPLSLDKRPRYYLPECTSSTIAGMAMFAASGVVYRSLLSLKTYGDDLIKRAELAWNRAKITTSNFTTFQLNCDDQNIKAGDADNTAAVQLDNAFIASVYLYEATGKAEYKAFAETNYARVHVYAINWWGPYEIPQQLALLRFAAMPGVSETVRSNILKQKQQMNYQNSIDAYNSKKDLFRAHLDDRFYTWGSNQTKANAGNMNLDFALFGINNTNQSLYKEVAEQYLHWFHGINPLNLVFLSNMYEQGAENCVNEIFHYWFRDGSQWDNAVTSAAGPAPGYVTGGPNKFYSDVNQGITAQPHQRAYKDWNSNWPERSWEISEPAIYYQASYVALLSRLMPGSSAVEVPIAVKSSSNTVKEIAKEPLDWKVFPNPARDFVNIELQSTISYNGSVEVIDGTGRKVIQQSVGVIKGRNQFTVPLKQLPSGVYYIRVSGNNVSNSKVFIVQR